jgi:hypothetical protein
LASKLDSATAAASASAAEAIEAKESAASAVADAETARAALSGGQDSEESAVAKALEEKADAERKAQESQRAAQAARSDLDAARAEHDATSAERDSTRAELDAARAERDSTRAELDAARAERDVARASHDAARDASRAEVEAAKAASTRAVAQAEEWKSLHAAAEAKVAEAESKTMEPMSHADLEEGEVSDEAAGIFHCPKADVLLRASCPTGATGFRATQCQVDAGNRELRLLTLGPVGSPRVISFDDIVNVEKADDEQDKTISVYWNPNRNAQKGKAPMTVKLLPCDDAAANLLVAALTVFDRAAPGSLLLTPQSNTTPRTMEDDGQ